MPVHLCLAKVPLLGAAHTGSETSELYGIYQIGMNWICSESLHKGSFQRWRQACKLNDSLVGLSCEFRLSTMKLLKIVSNVRRDVLQQCFSFGL